MMAHVQKHLVGYATILSAMISVAVENLKAGWPVGPQAWTIFALEEIGVAASTVIAYRSVPRDTISNP